MRREVAIMYIRRKACYESGRQKVHLVRYTDDFVITAKSEEVAIQARELVKIYIEERGLTLSEEKTLITNISTGFDFLGWNFRKYDGKLMIKPSTKSIQKVINRIRDTIKDNTSSKQDYLITQLNFIIIGWSNYHQNVVARKIFEKRQMSLQANKVSGKFKGIWLKQKGSCPYCKRFMEDYKERIAITIQSVEMKQFPLPSRQAYFWR